MKYSTYSEKYHADLNNIVQKILINYPGKKLAFYSCSIAFNKWCNERFLFKHSIIVADGIARPLLVLFSSFNIKTSTIYAVDYVQNIGGFQILLIETVAEFQKIKDLADLLSFSDIAKQHQEMFYNYVGVNEHRKMHENLQLLEDASNSLNSYTSRPCTNRFIECSMLQKYMYKKIGIIAKTDEATHTQHQPTITHTRIPSCILAQLELSSGDLTIELYKNAYQKYTHQNIYSVLRTILEDNLKTPEMVKEQILNYLYKMKFINTKYVGILKYLYFSLTQNKKNLHNQIINTEYYSHYIESTMLKLIITKYGLQDLRYSKYSSYVNWHYMVDLYHMHKIVIHINTYNTK